MASDSTGGNERLYTAMIIDDQATSRIILETILNDIDENIRVLSFDSCLSALQVIETNPPDIILADYKMPVLNGIELTRRLRAIPQCSDIPIVIVTIFDDKSVLYEALGAGATEFLTKPVDQHECRVRCKNLLTIRKQQLLIKDKAENLQLEVDKAVAEIEAREKETLYRLALAGDYKDVATGSNLKKMGKISRMIAELVPMPKEQCEILEIAAPMHDIGKIGIPDRVLLKEAPLDEEESRIMVRHTEIGFDILKDSPSPYLRMGAEIALNHHEKYDGSGYPAGKRGEEIPLVARIATIADVFDALTAKRPYKSAWSVDDTLQYLKKEKAKHFDPELVDLLLDNIDNIIRETDSEEYNLYPSLN